MGIKQKTPQRQLRGFKQQIKNSQLKQTTMSEGIYLGESIPIPTEEYTVYWTPQKTRDVTLKEIVAYCENEMRKCEQDGQLLYIDKYFSLEEVKKHCEKLIEEIKW